MKKVKILFVFLITALSLINVISLKADLIKKDEIVLGGNQCIIQNSYGDVVEYNGPFQMVSGTMNIFGEEMERDFPNIYKSIMVETDSKYVCSKIKGNIHFDLNTSTHNNYYVDGENITKITVENKEVDSYMQVTGTGGKVHCNISMKQSNNDTDVNFYLNGTVTFRDSKEGIYVSGLTGIVDVFVDDYSGSTSGTLSGVFVVSDSEFLIKKNKADLIVTNAQKLSIKTKEHKTLKNVRIKPINNNKTMLLSWDNVKSAYKYKIYRYDYSKKKYACVDERMRTEYNLFDISNISPNTKYKYAVRAYSYNRIKRKYKALGKRVVVMAVSGDSVKGNVSKIKLKKKSIKAKTGKKIKLKYTIKVSGKKKPVSKKLTWYSSNKKIASFKKGKLVLEKKGTCKVYAMAHNGVVSKTIKVKVKK